jgi:sulfate permease, SulP family
MRMTRAAETASDAESEADQPGLSALRDAVERSGIRLPKRAAIRNDLLAGLNSAIANVPDGLASGLLVGVSPTYGLYATMVGPLVGGVFASTQLMVITTTSAASLAAGQALAGTPAAERSSALFLMTIAVGAFQILFGLLRLGRVMRFVSYSVMTGFLTGIAVLTVLSQLPTVTGYAATGGNKIVQTIDVLRHLGQVDLPTLVVAALALMLAALLPRTPLGNWGSLAAIVIPSTVVALFRLSRVQVVRDVGAIPHGLPTPFVPSLSALSPDVVTGALAVATIILVQGAGVSQSVPNPGGSRSNASHDFIAEGAANVVSGLFRGLPVGGSLSSTALNMLAGARSRWAAIFSGLWVAAIVLVVPGLIAYVAMPALGALLIVASAGAIKPAAARSIWNTGWSSRIAILATFLATLVLPIQVAVAIGVVISALLALGKGAADVSLVEMVERPDGRIEERTPPKRLPSGDATVFEVYGPLFYAGARTLARLLPQPDGAERPVVILRLRGRGDAGATLIDVLATYADKLQAAGGRLYLTGVGDRIADQMARTGKLAASDRVRIYEATPIVGESTSQALADARAWLARGGSAPRREPPASDADARGGGADASGAA